MNARDIIDLLAAKHCKDVFVPECKDGPTQISNHRRLDAWAMAKSWVNPCCYGYEIKVSRSDFLSDDKWRAYLPLCNRFSFVAPKGLIGRDELEPGVGLLEVLGTRRLVTRVKAAYREIDPPESLYRYVLMCRTGVVDEITQTSERDRLRAWIAEKAEDRKLGYEVSRAIREKVNEAEYKFREIERRETAIKEAESRLSKLGLTGIRWDSDEELRRKVKLREIGASVDLLREIERAAETLTRLAKDIARAADA